MASYSLDIELPGEAPRYVPSREFPNDMRVGDQFEFDGYKLQVAQVATKQFDAGSEPDMTLRCIPA